MKFRSFVIGVLVAISLVGSIGYYYIHTPQFTLYMIQRSVDNHDWNGFNRFVDMDSFFDSAMSDIGKSSDSVFVKGLSVVMAGTIKDKFKSEFRKAIEGASDVSSNKVMEVLYDVKPGEKLDVENMGKIAKVTVSSETSALNIPTKYYMMFRDEGIFYKLIGVDDSLQREARKVENKLLKDHYNLAIDKELRTAVTLKSISKTKGCSQYINSTCIQHIILNTTKVFNNTDREISEVLYNVYPSKELIFNEYERYGSAKNIPAKKAIIIGKDRGPKYNKYSDSDKLFMNASIADLHYKVFKVTYSDGSVVEKDDYSYMVNMEVIPTLDAVLERRKEYGVEDNYGVEGYLN